MKWTLEEIQKFNKECEELQIKRVVKFQQHLIDNDHIMTNDAAHELLEIVEDFLEKEGTWERIE